jgi:hypothetical protein
MEVIRSSETSVHIQTTQRHIPEDGNIHNYRCENLKSYTMFFIVWLKLSLCLLFKAQRFVCTGVNAWVCIELSFFKLLCTAATRGLLIWGGETYLEEGGGKVKVRDWYWGDGS